MQVISRLWKDESGFVQSAEMMLIATLVVIGLIVGLASLRDGIAQELEDTGQAINQLDQSYSINVSDGGAGVITVSNLDVVTVNLPLGNVVNVTATFKNFGYNDLPDFCQQPDVNGQAPGCMMIAAGFDREETGAAPTPSPIP